MARKLTPKRLDRTGETTFVAEYDDGSKAMGSIDPTITRFSEDSKASDKVYFMGKPCSVCGSKWHEKCK
jgi:hypothetical protein